MFFSLHFFLKNFSALFFSHLSVAKSDCEPAKVAVDDLDGVILGAGDVEGVGRAGNNLLHLKTPGIVNNNVWGGNNLSENFNFNLELTIMTADVEKMDDEQT